LLDGMRPEERPDLVRGDADYGTDPVMAALEARGQDYLFKLRVTANVRKLIERMAGQLGWRDAGHGWQAAGAAFLSRLRTTAPQLTPVERWCAILGRALAPYLHGRTPRPRRVCSRPEPNPRLQVENLTARRHSCTGRCGI